MAPKALKRTGLVAGATAGAIGLVTVMIPTRTTC